MTRGALLLCPLLLAACSNEAKVQIGFTNRTGQAEALTSSGAGLASRGYGLEGGQTPGLLGMKLVVMYLVEDVDPVTQNNVGQVGRIWVNPVCDESLSFCGVGPEAGAHEVKDYFEFALPSEQVNANLNSQALPFPPGTYRYIRVSFGGAPGSNNQTTPNMRFGTDLASAVEVRPNFGNGFTTPIDPPLELVAGSTVGVTLDYDLASSFYPALDGSGGKPPAGGSLDHWYCAGPGNPKTGPCIYFEGFKARVTGVTAPPPDAGTAPSEE